MPFRLIVEQSIVGLTCSLFLQNLLAGPADALLADFADVLVALIFFLSLTASGNCTRMNFLSVPFSKLEAVLICLFEMFFEVKKSSFSSRFFSQIAPLSSLEEAVEPEVFHSQTFKQTNQNSFLVFINA